MRPNLSNSCRSWCSETLLGSWPTNSLRRQLPPSTSAAADTLPTRTNQPITPPLLIVRTELFVSLFSLINWNIFATLYSLLIINDSEPRRNAWLRHYSTRSHYDLDLWPLTVKTFSVMPTLMMKFHWNPQLKWYTTITKYMSKNRNYITVIVTQKIKNTHTHW